MSPAEGEEGSFRVTDRRRRSDEPAAPAAETAPRARPPGERNLVALFMMLGTSALAALGEDADPAATPPQRDLPAAAEFIDALVLLRDKTEGHRSEQETRVLEDLLYDLQLRYVAATKRPG